MTVTREELDALRASLARPALHLTFTPDNSLETQVHSALFQQQQIQLNRGEQSLQRAQENLRRELKKLRSEDQNRDLFNAISHTGALNHQL